MVTLAAIASGATAVIFAAGLNSSLDRAAARQTHSVTAPVQIINFSVTQPDAIQDAAVTTALAAQPGTLHQTAAYQDQVTVPGIAGNVNATAFGADAAWSGYGIIAGRWYAAPGEADVNTAFLTAGG
jgi:putative ABC transport system permease protein